MCCFVLWHDTIEIFLPILKVKVLNQTEIKKDKCLFLSFFNLFISLLPASQARPVVVSETQEIVVRHKPFNGVPHHVDVDGLLLQAKPKKCERIKLKSLNTTYNRQQVYR